MTNETTQQKAARIKSQLQMFTGDLDRFRHSINRHVIYTPGIQYLAEEAGAYWLIDAIASWIGSHSFNQAARRDQRIGEMHFWQLEVDQEARSAVLTARADSGEPAFITQRIPFSDFPLAKIDVWAAYDGTNWTLYLPSEH